MDPASATVLTSAITSTVSALAAYMQYRVGMKQAEQKGEAAPTKPDKQTLEKGEQALVVVQEAVAEHGNEDEQADLANFERNPERYQKQFEQVLLDIAAREPTFADRILKLQPQKTTTNEININHSTVQGPVVSEMKNSTIKQTFNK